jgi:hypothetical protein
MQLDAGLLAALQAPSVHCSVTGQIELAEALSPNSSRRATERALGEPLEEILMTRKEITGHALYHTS